MHNTLQHCPEQGLGAAKVSLVEHGLGAAKVNLVEHGLGAAKVSLAPVHAQGSVLSDDKTLP